MKNKLIKWKNINKVANQNNFIINFHLKGIRHNFSTDLGLTDVEIIDLNRLYMILLTFLYLFYF